VRNEEIWDASRLLARFLIQFAKIDGLLNRKYFGALMGISSAINISIGAKPRFRGRYFTAYIFADGSVFSGLRYDHSGVVFTKRVT
jgi:hypothetical protein